MIDMDDGRPDERYSEITAPVRGPYRWSRTSRERMAGVHPKLIEVADAALARGLLDLTVLRFGGVRTLEEQKALVAEGKSKTMRSKHLIQSDGYGHALDLAPYPVVWSDIPRFRLMGLVVMQEAARRGIPLIWGGNWKTFRDYPHFELVEA